MNNDNSKIQIGWFSTSPCITLYHSPCISPCSTVSPCITHPVSHLCHQLSNCEQLRPAGSYPLAKINCARYWLTSHHCVLALLDVLCPRLWKCRFLSSGISISTLLYYISQVIIDDRHRNPNINIREIIWLGNKLHQHMIKSALIWMNQTCHILLIYFWFGTEENLLIFINV